MKAFRQIAVLLLAVTCAISIRAAEIQFVSDSEYARDKKSEKAAGGEFTPKLSPVPGAPTIELVQPKTNEILRTPFPFKLVFHARDSAEIVPTSFRVLYGFLKLDITDRVVQKVKPSKEGVFVEEASVPAGEHKLLVQIADSEGRVGATTLVLKVDH